MLRNVIIMYPTINRPNPVEYISFSAYAHPVDIRHIPITDIPAIGVNNSIDINNDNLRHGDLFLFCRYQMD